MNLAKGVCSGQLTDQMFIRISNYDIKQLDKSQTKCLLESQITIQITDQIFREKEKNSRQLALPRIFTYAPLLLFVFVYVFGCNQIPLTINVRTK